MKLHYFLIERNYCNLKKGKQKCHSIQIIIKIFVIIYNINSLEFQNKTHTYNVKHKRIYSSPI